MRVRLHVGAFSRSLTLTVLALVHGCAEASEPAEDTVAVAGSEAALCGGDAEKRAQIARGRDIWVKSTFGGEKFFSLLAPRVLGFTLGFDAVLTTPRASRFERWGVINDPDCTAGDASTGYLDRCADPQATGVLGIRKFPDPSGQKPFLIGAACASCHAGFDASNPPANPNEPDWDNIHLTAGNQFLRVGDLFSAHLTPADPRYQVFQTWAPGTVDTTAIESDGINNPGIITQFFEFPNRPYFDLHDHGMPIRVHRAGQGGEDDAGCEKAALRVYFNIGMCAAECMLPHLTNGPGGSQTPIDLAECEARCPEYAQAKAAVVDECAFINDARSTPVPHLLDAPGGHRYVNMHLARRGERVFERACASCHSNGARREEDDVFSNDQLLVATGFRFDPTDASGRLGEAAGTVATNACRARTTNWQDGHIWAAFASDEQRARGPGFTRNVPLTGAWSTAPFFHNNRLGTHNASPGVAARVAAFEGAMKLLLNPALRDFPGSVQRTSAAVTLPNGLTLPAGTPVGAFANVNPATGVNACPDYVENGGHYYGAGLSDADKAALTEYVKTL